MCCKEREIRRDSLKCYIHMSFSVTSYVNLWFAEVQIIGCMDLSKDPKSHRIFPDSITEYHSARLARLPNTKAKSRALHLCCKWKLVPPPSSSLATLISRQNRCALRCRVVLTERVHWFTLWATGLLLQRVYECTRMNKTRVVRLVGIDSGARYASLANVKSAVPSRKCACITLPENAEIEFLRFSAPFPTPFSSVARKIYNTISRFYIFNGFKFFSYLN